MEKESKSLAVVQQMPVSDMMSMAETFVQSGMFTDTKAVAQAFVKIQAGQEIGIAPFAAMSGIHVIQGKPTIGAGIIASRIKGSGKYDYEVKQLDERACSIDFFQGKKLIGNSKFTIEDARKASTKNIDKFPKNMLFARAISNGVKWFCPDVFSGPVYVPEEMHDLEPGSEPKQPQNQSNPNTEGLALCTNEDIDRIMELLDDTVLPEVIFKSDSRPQGYQKIHLKKAIQKQFDSGAYEKHQAEAQIKGLEEEIELHKKSAANQPAPVVDLSEGTQTEGHTNKSAETAGGWDGAK